MENRTSRALGITTAAAALLLAVPSAHAWSDLGHQVVARIAWQSMTPGARTQAVQLLAEAPADSDLTDLRPSWGSSADRLFFARAATWPDQVRDRDHRERHERYHRSNWHYINYFWDPPAPGQPVRERTDLQPQATNAVERLAALAPRLADPDREPAARAIDLAWVLHLAGDLHQPLHTSGRVTKTAPRGDRGGNDFPLAGDHNLHQFWDRLPGREYPRRFWQSEDRHLERVAGTLRRLNPEDSFGAELRELDFETWAREGFELAWRSLYPPELREGHDPPASYREAARKIGERRIALAGYRLGALLNRILDPSGVATGGR